MRAAWPFRAFFIGLVLVLVTGTLRADAAFPQPPGIIPNQYGGAVAPELELGFILSKGLERIVAFDLKTGVRLDELPFSPSFSWIVFLEERRALLAVGDSSGVGDELHLIPIEPQPGFANVFDRSAMHPIEIDSIGGDEVNHFRITTQPAFDSARGLVFLSALVITANSAETALICLDVSSEEVIDFFDLPRTSDNLAPNVGRLYWEQASRHVTVHSQESTFALDTSGEPGEVFRSISAGLDIGTSWSALADRPEIANLGNALFVCEAGDLTVYDKRTGEEVQRDLFGAHAVYAVPASHHLVVPGTDSHQPFHLWRLSVIQVSPEIIVDTQNVVRMEMEQPADLPTPSLRPRHMHISVEDDLVLSLSQLGHDMFMVHRLSDGALLEAIPVTPERSGMVSIGGDHLFIRPFLPQAPVLRALAWSGGHHGEISGATSVDMDGFIGRPFPQGVWIDPAGTHAVALTSMPEDWLRVVNLTTGEVTQRLPEQDQAPVGIPEGYSGSLTLVGDAPFGVYQLNPNTYQIEEIASRELTAEHAGWGDNVAFHEPSGTAFLVHERDDGVGGEVLELVAQRIGGSQMHAREMPVPWLDPNATTANTLLRMNRGAQLVLDFQWPPAISNDIVVISLDPSSPELLENATVRHFVKSAGYIGPNEYLAAHPPVVSEDGRHLHTVVASYGQSFEPERVEVRTHDLATMLPLASRLLWQRGEDDWAAPTLGPLVLSPDSQHLMIPMLPRVTHLLEPWRLMVAPAEAVDGRPTDFTTMFLLDGRTYGPLFIDCENAFLTSGDHLLLEIEDTLNVIDLVGWRALRSRELPVETLLSHVVPSGQMGVALGMNSALNTNVIHRIDIEFTMRPVDVLVDHLCGRTKIPTQVLSEHDANQDGVLDVADLTFLINAGERSGQPIRN